MTDLSWFETSRAFSEEKISKLREILKDGDHDPTYTIVVGGSLARREASPCSDIDYFYFAEDSDAMERARNFLKSKEMELLSEIGKPPSTEGAFGSGPSETMHQLVSNIGGEDDENGKITRRILFLLEGEWLTSHRTFQKYRRTLLERYVPESIKDTQIARFLLNDIIRYYRTICVDFEFKTHEKNKGWASRYIKLRFSRKLLYFGGILAVAETKDLPRTEKIEKIERLLNIPTTRRILDLCDHEDATAALSLYGDFWDFMRKTENRDMLETIKLDMEEYPQEFEIFRKKGRSFSTKLSDCLLKNYDKSHPIHQALIF